MKLSDKSRKILELISSGHTYEQILSLDSGFTYVDIFASAEEALALDSLDKSNYQDRLNAVKQKHPNAYESWTSEQENLLRKMHKGGAPIHAIASALKRQPGAVSSRIRKLGL